MSAEAAGEKTPLEKLNAAISEFANAISEDGNVLVDTAVVIWERIRLDEEGDVMRKIEYACPTDHFSMTSGLGLIEAGGAMIRRDVLSTYGADDR